MIEIYATVAQKSCDDCEARLLAIDVVFAGVVFENLAGNNKLRIGDYFMATPRLEAVS